MSEKGDRAVALFRKGHACSQAIVRVFGPAYGLDEGTSMRLGAGLEAGMWAGGSCGAVSGAMLILGMAFCPDDCEKPRDRRRARAAMQEFSRRFRERNGTINCTRILGKDVSTEDGLNAAAEKGLFKTVCPNMVRDAAEILEDILSEHADV